MISNSRSSMVGAIILVILMYATTIAQTQPGPVEADLCRVVASPAEYNGKVLSVEGILSPSEHSLALYSPSCKPNYGFNVTIQAVFPPSWELKSWPNGKQLRKILRGQKNALVRVSGTFESGVDRYGPDVARFRFVISGISSVKRAKDVSGQ